MNLESNQMAYIGAEGEEVPFVMLLFYRNVN